MLDGRVEPAQASSRFAGAAPPAVAVEFDRVVMHAQAAWMHQPGTAVRHSHRDVVRTAARRDGRYHSRQEPNSPVIGRVMDHHTITGPQRVPIGPQHALTPLVRI